jgi:hypothetical protein
MPKSNYQLYHGENMLHFDEMMMSTLYWTNMQNWIFIVLASSLKQQSAGIHVAPLVHEPLSGHISGVMGSMLTLSAVDREFEPLSGHISGIMGSMLTLSAVDREFEPLSGHIKDYEIGICCFSTKK